MTEPTKSEQLPEGVESVIETIANMQAPASAVNRAIDLALSNQKTVSVHHIKPSKRWLRWSAIAASFALILGSAVLLSESKSLYAKMQESAAKARVIEFKSRVFDGDNKLLREIRSAVQLQPRMIRQQFPDETIVIGDITNQKGIRMDPVAKTATHFSMVGGIGPSSELFDSVMHLVFGGDAKNVKEVGRTKSDGKDVVQYAVEDGRWDADVFIDLNSKMPTRIVVNTGDRQARVEAVEFVFDRQVDTALFKFEAPEGYEVVNDGVEEFDDSELVLDPATSGMSSIKFGMSFQNVVEFLGQPELIGHPADEDHSTVDVLNYFSRGIQISIDSNLGVSQISVFDDSVRFVTGDFGGQFKGGLKLGDSRPDVIKVMGKPTQSSEQEGGTLIYRSENQDVFTCFIFRDEALIGITMNKTASEKD